MLNIIENLWVGALLVALSLSLDALGIGVSYGARGIKVNNIARAVIFIIVISVTGFFSNLGNALSSCFGENFARNLGILILVLMGIWVILQNFISEKADKNVYSEKKNETVYSIIIKSLGITVKIIKNPHSVDLNKNNLIEPKEAVYLGLALSLDSMGAGLAAGAIGLGGMVLPVFSGIFQIMFLCIGAKFGEKLAGNKGVKRAVGVFSGLMLIIIGLMRFI